VDVVVVILKSVVKSDSGVEQS